MKTKFIFPLILILFYCISANSQEVTKFRAKSAAVKLLNENGVWEEWSNWEETNFLITYNSDNQRITFYESRNRTFDIIDSKEETNNEGDTILLMNCLGHKESKCVVKIRISEDNEFQFYIYYDGAIFVYNVNPLEY